MRAMPEAAAHNVATLGQVFTPESVVTAMLTLRQNHGRVLEPACGDGAFSRRIPDCVAIEIDRSHAPAESLNIDFFAYPETEKFDTILGNPPYVKYQDIAAPTRRLLRSRLFDSRSNLYLFFIEKSVRHLNEHGELIFITPRDFLKTTSSTRLNSWLYQQGTITHAMELGDAKVFANATPNCLIWRFQKGLFRRQMRYAEIGNKDDLARALAAPRWQARHFVEAAGHFMFTRTQHSLRLKDIACVKVGAVSGADDIFASAPHGNRDFVCSETCKTGRTRKMIWTEKTAPPPPVLLPHKARLLARGIRPFDESNWWLWGRGYPQSDRPRVYVNGRTRQKAPFFLHACPHFDGSVLAIFPHNERIALAEFCAALNRVDWEQLGFVCDGRHLFSQRSLENAPLPDEFARFLPQP